MTNNELRVYIQEVIDRLTPGADQLTDGEAEEILLNIAQISGLSHVCMYLIEAARHRKRGLMAQPKPEFTDQLATSVPASIVPAKSSEPPDEKRTLGQDAVAILKELSRSAGLDTRGCRELIAEHRDDLLEAGLLARAERYVHRLPDRLFDEVMNILIQGAKAPPQLDYTTAVETVNQAREQLEMTAKETTLHTIRQAKNKVLDRSLSGAQHNLRSILRDEIVSE